MKELQSRVGLLQVFQDIVSLLVMAQLVKKKVKKAERDKSDKEKEASTMPTTIRPIEGEKRKAISRKIIIRESER